jgi:hypothetical protein
VASGVSRVTWLYLRDEPLATSFFQAGLYLPGTTMGRDQPKPALRAFRFPVVAFPGRDWGQKQIARRYPR